MVGEKSQNRLVFFSNWLVVNWARYNHGNIKLISWYSQRGCPPQGFTVTSPARCFSEIKIEFLNMYEPICSPSRMTQHEGGRILHCPSTFRQASRHSRQPCGTKCHQWSGGARFTVDCLSTKQFNSWDSAAFSAFLCWWEYADEP